LVENINILLITIDCLRADYLGCINKEKKLTPNLDQIAKEGVLFSQAISPGPYTRSSFPSILSGTYPNIYPDPIRFSKFCSTIAEILSKNGFNTIGFNSNALISSFFGYDKGFKHFYDILSVDSSKKRINNTSNLKFKDKISHKIEEIIAKRPFIKGNVLKILDIIPKVEYTKPDDAKFCTQKILPLLNKNKKNLFLWLHYMDVHGPYTPPKKLRKLKLQRIFYVNELTKENPKNVSKDEIRDLIDLYKGAIKHMDEHLGILFRKLKELDIYDQTLFIITSDHGEEFREHKDLSHHDKLYDELIHIPLIIKGPNLYTNTKVDKVVSSIDIISTILDYLGFEEKPDFMGESLLPLLKKSDREYSRSGVISETIRPSPTHKVSYRTEDWKLIVDLKNKNRELYNLKRDPGEQNNIYKEKFEFAEKFRKIISDHLVIEYKMKLKFEEMQKISDIVKRIKI